MYVLINIYFSVIKSDKKQVKFFSEHVNCVTYTYRQEKNQNNFFFNLFLGICNVELIYYMGAEPEHSSKFYTVGEMVKMPYQ